MNVIITLLTIFEVIVCLLLSLLVLMQRPRQEGLGAAFGSGVTDQMFGAQTTNVLQKATVYMGVALFVLTFLLAICVSKQNDRAAGKATFVDPTDQVAKPPTPPAPAGNLPGARVETEAGKKVEGENAATPPASTTPSSTPAPAPTAPADSKPATSTPPPPPAGSAIPPAATTPTPAPAPAPTNPPSPPAK